MQTDMIFGTAEVPFFQRLGHDLSNTKSLPNGTIRLDHPKLQAGVHYCEFVADEFLDSYFQNDAWQLIVGIVSDAFDFHDPTKFIGSDASSFGYVVQTGQLLCCGTLQEYAHPATPGGRIGIMVNLNKDELSFHRDGEDLGPAFKGFANKASHFYFGLSVVQQPPSMSLNPTTPSISVAAAPSLLHSAFNCSRVHSGGEQSLSMELVNSSSVCSSTLSCSILGGGEQGDLASSSDSHTAMDECMLDFFDFECCPDDIKLEILSWLTVNELKSTRLVSRAWQQLSNDDFIWGPISRSVIPPADSLRRKEEVSYFNIYNRENLKFADKSLGVEITNHGRTVASSEAVSFWAASQLEYPRMVSGIHYCEFVVDAFRQGSIGNTWKVVIGVVSNSFDYQLTKWVGVDEKSFGYIAQNGKKVGPSCKNQGAPYGEPYKDDDVIGVLLDIDGKRIKFYKNGQSLGTAFSDAEFNQMKGHSYHFAVSLARPGMTVSAKKYERLGPSTDFETFDPKTLL